MSDFTSQIKGVAHSENATGAIYALIGGMVLGNALPSPSDAWFFYEEKKLRDRWKKGELTAEKYWELNTLYYYLLPMLYWLAVGAVIVGIKGDATKKLKLMAVLVGGGVVAGVILKMIQTDKKQLDKEDQERLLLLKNHPEVVEILKKPEFENIAGQIIGSPNGDDKNKDVKYVKLYAERQQEAMDSFHNFGVKGIELGVLNDKKKR